MDDIDRAAEYEETMRQDAIRRALAPLHDETGQERDEQGRVLCAECGEVISLARLDKIPTATRCTDCQDKLDVWSKTIG